MRLARITLTPRFTNFFTDFEKKTRSFCSLTYWISMTLRDQIRSDPGRICSRITAWDQALWWGRGEFVIVLDSCCTRHSKSNPIALNFNRTQSNSIELNRWIEFDWVRQSNEIELAEKKKNQSNPIERLIFEVVIYVKQTLKIRYQILEARVTSALSAAHVFFVDEEIPQKWLQMRCGS